MNENILHKESLGSTSSRRGNDNTLLGKFTVPTFMFSGKRNNLVPIPPTAKHHPSIIFSFVGAVQRLASNVSVMEDAVMVPSRLIGVDSQQVKDVVVNHQCAENSVDHGTGA